MTFGTMQFTAAVLMLLLTIKLLLLRSKRRESIVARRTRWLLAIGTSLMGIHFALQLQLGLRPMGVSQSVMLNLALLMPASFIFSVAVLHLQRRGQLNRTDLLIGPLAWLAAMIVLGTAILTDGIPLLLPSPKVHNAEIIGAALYLITQGYYSWRHARCLIAMRRALEDYYDSDTAGILNWMQLSIAGLLVLALLVPAAIFNTGPVLLIIAFAAYFFIFYLVDSFCAYINSSAPAHIQKAEKNAEDAESDEDETDKPLSDETAATITTAVEQWIANGGHLRSGLIQPIAAANIGIPKYQLKTWLHMKGMKYNEWIAMLRIEEAKNSITAHPDWSNDAIAQHCGFSDRTVLQRTFKRLVGMTPAQYLREQTN